MLADAAPRPEFSRFVGRDELSKLPLRRSIRATPEECSRLAERFGLLSLDLLEADLEIKWVSPGVGGRLCVEGRFDARVTQRCVVSLEPVAASLRESFELFGESDSQRRGEGDDATDEILDPDDEVFEVTGSEGLDLGELVAQQLSLALEPYPRKPGVVLEDRWANEPEEGARESDESPFAKLRDLRSKQ